MYKHFNHEGGNCSPLIAHWPKGIKQPNRWVRTPIHLIDLMPTICAITGATYPTAFNGHSIHKQEGTSLTPIFDGANALPSRTLCFDHFESSAIRQGDWKLVRGNKRYNDQKWELYNIGEDRCETNDLIKTHPEKAKILEDAWITWAKRVQLQGYRQPSK